MQNQKLKAIYEKCKSPEEIERVFEAYLLGIDTLAEEMKKELRS